MKYSGTLFLLIVLLLAGCGQKGPLYLPGDRPAQRNTTPTQTEQNSSPDNHKAERP